MEQASSTVQISGRLSGGCLGYEFSGVSISTFLNFTCSNATNQTLDMGQVERNHEQQAIF